MNTIKSKVLRLIQSLPDDCTLADIQYHLYILEQVEQGLADVAAGRIVPHEEAKRRIAEFRRRS